MSNILNELENSIDPINQEIARALRAYQSILASNGRRRSLGYEPRDIRKYGAVEVIERRVRKKSSGFETVPPEDSYEAIVLKFPGRFSQEIVEIAENRFRREEKEFEPTTDTTELDCRVARLLKRAHLSVPNGTMAPRRVITSSTVFFRDPKVKAFVLKRASGRCECCDSPAPFKTQLGLNYLEVHHIKTLAEGGSDRVENSVALCPNCHRALHYADNASELTSRIFTRVSGLIRE